MKYYRNIRRNVFVASVITALIMILLSIFTYIFIHRFDKSIVQ